MTPRDSHDGDLDAGRQARRRGRVTRDTATGQRDTDLSPGDKAGRPILYAGGPRYGSELAVVPPPPAAGQAAQRHRDDAEVEVRIEFVVLDGPAGQALRRRQAQIVRKVLRWIADHPDPTTQKTPS